MGAPRPSRWSKCRKLVKPPDANFSPQTTDYNPEINLKKWRVYPFRSDILELVN